MRTSNPILLQLGLLSIASALNTMESLTASYKQVPSTAAGPPVPTPPAYRLQSFGQGAYMVTDGLYQAMFLVACESVIVVDTPPSIGENMFRAIRSVTTKPISHIVYSHAHADHIGGVFVFGSPLNRQYIAHQLTAELLSYTADYDHRPAPTTTFDDSYTLNVCNQTLQLDYRGENHEPGNIFIYAPKQKVLMLVDIVYPGWAPFNALGEVQNVPGYIRAHDQLLTYDFDHYIGGHLDRPGTRQDVVVARDFIHDLFNTSKVAVQMSAQANNSISFSSVIGPYATKTDPSNGWALFEIYLDTLADWVTEQLSSRWSTKLYGFDVYGKSHAITMLESVRIDFGTLGPFGVTNL